MSEVNDVGDDCRNFDKPDEGYRHEKVPRTTVAHRDSCGSDGAVSRDTAMPVHYLRRENHRSTNW